MNDRTLANISWRRRAPIWLALVIIVGMSWLYLVHMSVNMSNMGATMPMSSTMAHHAIPMQRALPLELSFSFIMWSVMMVAMMVPTAIPAISLFTTLTGRRHTSQDPTVTTAIYIGGYIAVWVGYALLAALAQWALTRAMLLPPMAGSSSVSVSALILLGAGVYQFTPLKDACLTQCRSPLAFFMAEWRDGGHGAFVLGLRQGAYCVTCCWSLMAIMFVVGVMNLAAMALLTLLMLAEKVAPAKWHINRAAGAALIAWGAWAGVGPWL